MKKRKISLGCAGIQRNFDDFRAIEIAKRAGADAVDFDLSGKCYTKEYSIYAKSEDEICTHYEKVKKLADDLEIEIGQTHGRIRGYYPETKEGWEEYNSEIHPKNARIDCMVTKILGAPISVFHGTSTLTAGEETPPEVMRKITFDMFKRSVPFAREFGVKIATETFGTCHRLGGCMDFFGDINEFLMMYNRICAIENFADYFTICVDTGHTNMTTAYGFPTPGNAIRILGSDVTCLHLHDNNIKRDSHQLLGVGTIDWNDVWEALDDIGYKGNYNLEVGNGAFGKALIEDTACFSVKILRNMLYEKYGE